MKDDINTPKFPNRDRKLNHINDSDDERDYNQTMSTQNVLFDEFKSMDCKNNVLSLTWKPKNTNQVSAFDKNKFVVFSNEGKIQEYTFFEKNFSVLDISSKGELCLSIQNPENLNTMQRDDRKQN